MQALEEAAAAVLADPEATAQERFLAACIGHPGKRIGYVLSSAEKRMGSSLELKGYVVIRAGPNVDHYDITDAGSTWLIARRP